MIIAKTAANYSARTTSLRQLGFILSIFLWLVFHSQIFARPYTVKSGDSLQRIAQRELGSASRWPEIARLNNLPPPHTIRLGQQLILPESQNSVIPLTPTRPPVLTTNPPPQVPPGNTVPLDPFSPTNTPLPSIETTSVDFISFLWQIPLALLGILLFEALNLRISCWFSLVETTYLRCLKLSLYLLLLAIFCFFMVMLLGVLGFAVGITGKFEPWSIAALVIVVPFALLAWFFLSLLVIKRTLDCQWRSVVTLLVMSSFVSWLLAAILLLSTASLGPIAQLLSNLSKP